MALSRDDRSRDLSRWDDPLGEDGENNPVGWKGVLWWGYGIVFLFFGVFGVWAALAPLESGAVAQGQVQVAGSQRVIQHLEGGIIEEILVREGDRVKTGQPLVVLDPTRARTQYDRIHQQYLAALGREARLKAERQDAKSGRGRPGLHRAARADSHARSPRREPLRASAVGRRG